MHAILKSFLCIVIDLRGISDSSRVADISNVLKLINVDAYLTKK